MAKITSLDQLKALYPNPTGRTLKKEMRRLDKHSRRFISLSPFLILGTVGPDGLGDVSPRGEAPGFVQVPDDQTLLIPDRPGNNRLDTLTNLLENPAIGILFLIPGVNETLRINGIGEIRDDPELCSGFTVQGKQPRSVLLIRVQQAYLHCAKSLMRSKLWEDKSIVERSVLPTMGEMINDQTGEAGSPESQQDMIARYEKMFY